MLAEITPDRKSLLLYEGETIYHTYHILLETEGYILFTDGKGDPVKVLAAKITCHPDGTLATFTDRIHADEWAFLHKAFKQIIKSS